MNNFGLFCLIRRISGGRCLRGESFINVDNAKVRSPKTRLLQNAANGAKYSTRIWLYVARYQQGNFFLKKSWVGKSARPFLRTEEAPGIFAKGIRQGRRCAHEA